MTRFGNVGVEKSSRMARRYATPATARGIINEGSPMRLNLREQITSDASKMAPSPYSLCDDVSFTGLPYSMTKLRDFLLPFIEPCRGSWCFRWSEPQFPSQQNHVFCDINVVEGFREARCKSKDLRAHQQSVERAARSHTFTFEERRVSGLSANQIIASIVGWPDNHVMRGEYFERAVQSRWGKVWTVAIEGDDMLPASGSEVSKNGSESCGETFPFLPYDLHCIA